MSQDRNPNIHLSMLSQTQLRCQSCELASQLTCQICDREPPWWNKETQATWTDRHAMVKLWQKERSEPYPDLNIKAQMQEKTEVFNRGASEAKDGQWKSFCGTHNTCSFLAILPTDGGLLYKHYHPPPHRC